MTRSIRLFITAALLLSCLLPLSAMAQTETPAAMTQEEAKAQFLREFLWSQNFGVVGMNQYGQAVSSTTYMNVYQGIIPRPIGTEELFTIVGRDDLTAEYKRLRRRKSAVTWSGIGVMSAGLALTMFPFYLAVRDEGASDLKVWPLVAGISSILGGSIIVTVGAIMRTQVLEAWEIQELINDYNYRLLNDLGLEEDALPQEPQKRDVEGLQVNLFHHEKGTGLTLGFRF